MKKYIKPTAEVLELSVKESLSAVPGDLGLGIKSVQSRAVAVSALETIYAKLSTINNEA